MPAWRVRPTRESTLATVSAHERLPTDRRPRSVDIVEALPKNHYGKILRREIRDAARARHPADRRGDGRGGPH